MSGLLLPLLPLLQVATFVALAVLAYRVGAHRRVDFFREAMIVIGAYIAYSFVRGSTASTVLRKLQMLGCEVSQPCRALEGF